MAQSQFLDDFQAKMDRLATIRVRLQQSVQVKTDFTNELKRRLREINNSIIQLADLINALKTNSDALQGQIGTHTESINSKDRQVEQLTQQIQEITAERDRINQQFTEYRDQTQAQLVERQNRIDEMEGQLANLTREKEAAENQLRELQNQIQARGDQKDIEHAEALRRLTEDTQRQLQEKDAQILQLTQRIHDYDQQILELQEQLRNKDNEHQETRNQLDQHQNQAQGQVDDLNREIERLSIENRSLVRKLIDSTEAIHQANEELELIINSIPDATQQEEVDGLLNSIQQSIENISRAAQGQPLLGQPPQPQGQPPQGQPPQPRIDPNIPVQVSGYNMTYGEILSQLQIKARQEARSTGNQDNKYNRVLIQIQNSGNPAEIENLLRRSAVSIKRGRNGNGTISGGRKTRKNRKNKQKGGFTYRTNSKRRGITLKSSRRSSRNSSRRSSR